MKNNVFTQNPDLKSYHETSDGVKFFRDQDAHVHARGLKNKAIKEVTRGSLMVDEVISEVKAKKVKSLKPNPATEASKDEAPKTDAKSDKVDQQIASETLTPMAQAKLRIEALEKLETVEAVEKALEGETAKSVKKAGEAKIEALKAV
ncbi:MAG: hypothetical protein ACOH2D_11625 [Gelidibacter sp.]